MWWRFSGPPGFNDEPLADHESSGITIRDVRKSYDGRLALDVTALDVPPRTTLALIGPSGCGKSTLLHIMAGLSRPTSGAVRLADSLRSCLRRTP